tara:strand:+ start:548 stop:691 length:144 start_codon:yes stop_codon:yes gene_type:complete
MKGKKGMEMWVLVLMILSIILLILVIVWYKDLGSFMKEILSRLGGGY